MNKQELRVELIRLRSLEGNYNDYPVESRRRLNAVGKFEGINAALKLIDQLDEPEKAACSKTETTTPTISKMERVVIPQFVADWIEKHKYSNDLIDLYSEVEYATDSDGFKAMLWEHSKEFYDWLSNDTNNIYVLADAMRYGYTIEKESVKTRQVLVKFFDNEEYKTELTEDAARELIEFLEANKHE